MFPQQVPGANRPSQVSSSLPPNSIQGIPGMPPSGMMSTGGPSSGFGMLHSFPGNMPMNIQPNQNKMWPQVQQQTFKQQDTQCQQYHQQPQNQKDHKHRDYLKQQQRLKAMPLSSSKGMSADALIGNLLEKKDTFTPRQSVPTQGQQQGDRHDMLTQIPQARQQAQPVATMNRGAVGAASPNDNLPGWLIPSSSRLPSIYSHIWSLVCDPASGGTLVDTNKILALLLTSSLPKEVLGFIWNLATNGANVQLNQQQLYITLALVALAQMGCTFNNLSVLNFIPTPPIPTFNMNVPKSNTDDKLKQSESIGKPSVPLLAVPLSSASSPSSASAPAPPVLPQPVCSLSQNRLVEDDFADDFTDFQSADTSHVPSSSTLCTNLPATVVIQPSATAKQVVNELNHSVVTKLGRGHGRSIGSRLANHTLGAPKSNANQKPRRASTDSDNVYIQEDLGFNFEKNRINFQDPRGLSKYQETEDFSDFQVAAGLHVDVQELFPKCHPKPKAQDFMLKESAIRNESDDEDLGKQKEEELLSLDSPTSSKPPVVEFKSLPTQIEIPLVAPPPTKSTKELMSVDEDRYSALRLIELENSKSCLAENLVEANKSSNTDDFGDFVSADDMFSEIAIRDTGDSVKQTSFSQSNGLQITTVQNAEFTVDDWGASVFQSSQSSQQSSLLESRAPNETKSNYDDLSSAFSDLDLPKNNSDLSKVDPPTKWGFDFDLGKESPSLNFNSNFNDSTAQNDDDFGDFVGPESTKIDESNSQISSSFLSDQLWVDNSSSKPIAGTLSDNRSVSSLELAGVTLSRHGSLPSLDLNLFSTSEDTSEKILVLNSQVADWIRCLESSCSLLQAAASTFTNITTHSVLMEVLGTAEGKNYLSNLMEVHRVTWRIQRSYRQSGHESNQVDTILGSVSKVWSTLQTFYKLANIETAVEKDGSDEESGQPGCGVCGSPASRGVLEYGGHVYHAPCANLWLNCVNRTLPAHSPLL